VFLNTLVALLNEKLCVLINGFWVIGRTGLKIECGQFIV
jgi:hypothetical protein